VGEAALHPIEGLTGAAVAAGGGILAIGRDATRGVTTPCFLPDSAGHLAQRSFVQAARGRARLVGARRGRVTTVAAVARRRVSDAGRALVSSVRRRGGPGIAPFRRARHGPARARRLSLALGRAARGRARGRLGAAVLGGMFVAELLHEGGTTTEERHQDK